MSLVTRLADTAAGLAVATKRQARRVRLALEGRRLESKVRSEMAALGHELYSLLETGALRVDAPGVLERVTTIARLRAELGRRQAEIDAIGRQGEHARWVHTSIANIDHNATTGAASAQTAMDAAARKADSPAEEGGEG